MTVAYGVTATGFVVKRLAVILAELQDEARATFGAGANLDAREPLGQWIGIQAEREALLWELAEDVYNSAYPDTAEGVPLDNAAALSGVKRKPATYSTASATFLGTAATVIPALSVVSVDGNAAARFLTDAAMTIAAAVVEVQLITFDHVPTGGNWRVSWNGNATSLLAYNASAAAVQTAVRLLTGLSAATVTGNFTTGFTVTFTGVVGDAVLATITGNTLTYASGSVVPTVATTTPGLPAQVIGTLTAETAGAVQAPAAALTVIETPVSGWASVSNALDATVGNEIESDPDLKNRRAESVQKAGSSGIDAIRADIAALDDVAACFVFENDTNATVSGRPAHSFEAIVLGGADAAIAQVIWDDKGAGIQPYGTTTVVITDSQGFPHDVGFSRPTEVPIYVELDLVTTSEFPALGSALAKAAMVAYGAGLTIGDDVIVFPALVAKLATIAGITDVTVRIGISVSPTLDNNIVIGSTSIATFDTSRVVVNVS